MEELFYKLKKINILRDVLVIILGILFFSLGIILSIYINSIFLVIGISLCMLESVIILSTKIKKNNSKDILINTAFKENLPYLDVISNSGRLSIAYSLFDLSNISYKYETLLSFKGKKDDVVVSFSSSVCRFNGDGNDYYVRLYTFENQNLEFSNVDLIKNKCLLNYRFEVIGNRIYIISIAKGARGKVLSMYPKYFKKYEQWILRIKDEDLFINEVIKMIGGPNDGKISS